MSTQKNHEISPGEARDMVNRFKQNKPAGLAFSETFSKEAVMKLLNAQGCTSLRIYYGMKEDMEVHAILFAADEDGKNMLPKEGEPAADDIVILEDGWRCPPLCPDTYP